MNKGIIHKAVSGFYYVKSEGETVRCTAKGRFRHNEKSPLTGDSVLYERTEPYKGIITEILPRKSSFVRPPIANIDKMVIVASAAIPVSDPFLIDKMTVIALHGRCEPVICINKNDISDADDLYDIYKNTSFSVVKTSAVTAYGIDELIALIKESLSAFCGNSGVGKSSILNAIDPGFDIATGDISRKLGRGRHTTRETSLYTLSCGAVVADTPGFSSFETGYTVAPGEMQYYFPELKPFHGMCRFDDCAHLSEPGCAVTDAVSQGKIHASRYESYCRLYKQAKEHKHWEIK